MEADIIKTLRLIHLYPGVFIAPAVLFFALTGILQTFSLYAASMDPGDRTTSQETDASTA